MAKFKIKGEKKIPGYDDPDIEVEVGDEYSSSQASAFHSRHLL
jgi:hypothetical protein